MKIALLLLLFVFSLNKIESRITLDLYPDSYYSSGYGEEEVPVADEDITKFFNNPMLYDAVKMYHGRRPTDVYYKKPTPWGDLYTSYGWAPVTKKIKVLSAQRLDSRRSRSVVHTEDFYNPSSHSITVNTALNHTVENTVTTSWSEGSITTQSSSFGIDIKIPYVGLSAGTSKSSTAYWGRSETRSETVTIVSSRSMETVLRPGQRVRAELAVTTRYVEFYIAYDVSLRGRLVVNYNPTHRGHHFYGLSVRKVMRAAGINNYKPIYQVIRVAYHVDGRVTVTDI